MTADLMKTTGYSICQKMYVTHIIFNVHHVTVKAKDVACLKLWKHCMMFSGEEV